MLPLNPQYSSDEICTICDGEGEVREHLCKVCLGTGRVSSTGDTTGLDGLALELSNEDRD